MEPTKITPDILKKLKPADIICAEFTEGGAMGDAGTVRIFTIKHQIIQKRSYRQNV